MKIPPIVREILSFFYVVVVFETIVFTAHKLDIPITPLALGALVGAFFAVRAGLTLKGSKTDPKTPPEKETRELPPRDPR